MSVVVRFDQLGKAYYLGVINRGLLFKEWGRKLTGRGAPEDDPELFWALREVSFDVHEGEVVGILGRNGAGKSTLLKILSQITSPTKGCVKVKGRVASLLEVGTGFHLELTGRDNIFINGGILGMKRTEIARKLDEIIAFSGIENFIDTPVKRYSVGMRVRLAFAVAAHLEPEILVIDEVLAVGDAAFQQKCLGKIGEVSRSGRTVLFVSHNAASIEALCTRGVVLENGRVAFDGSQMDALEYYAASRLAAARCLRERTDRVGSGEVRVTAIELRNGRGESVSSVRAGEDIDIVLHYERHGPPRFPRLVVQIFVTTHLGAPVFTHANWLGSTPLGELPESGAFVCHIPRLPLPAGHFMISYRVLPEQWGGPKDPLDVLDSAAELPVEHGDFFGAGKLPPLKDGVVLVEAEWKVEAALPQPEPLLAS